MEVVSIGQIASQNAKRFGARAAFKDEFRTITFEAFEARARALRSALGAAGVAKGDRIALLSRNRIECLEVFLSSDLGAIVVPLNWRLYADELAYILGDCKPSVIVVEPEFLNALGSALDGLEGVSLQIVLGEPSGARWHAYEDFIRHEVNTAAGRPPAVPSDTACIVYTSGTTGRPKGALLSHAALLASARRIGQEMLALGPSDVTLAVMPFFHVGGMWFHCFPSFACGATTIIQAAFRADDVLTTVAEHAVTNVHLAPTMVGDLLDRPGTETAAASLKRIFYAASPMPVATLKRAMAQFPNSDFVQSYGSTETGPVTWLGPTAHLEALSGDQARLKSCGRPFDGVEIRLETELERGGVGELAVRSDSTMTGYWNNPKATAKTVIDGWIATGDLGRCDAEGYYFIVDRKNDMIITGGENVYPTEVEDALCGISGVAEAAVIGVPDDRWVERVVAYVVLRDCVELDADSIIRGCKQQLSSYKCPKEVFFVDALPKNGAGKILRRKLLEGLQN